MCLMQEEEPASLVRACVALVRAKNQKHNEGGDDDADDNEDQGWAGVTRSLFRWPNRRVHAWLDADSSPCGGLGKELPHGEVTVFFGT